VPESVIIVATRDVFAEIRDSDWSFGIIEFEGDITERGSEKDVSHRGRNLGYRRSSRGDNSLQDEDV
jgi:hypothetical protein